MKTYIKIDFLKNSEDDTESPIYNITKDKIIGVEVTASKEQLKRWKQVFTDYTRTQKEIENLVNEYQPLMEVKGVKKKCKPFAWR